MNLTASRESFESRVVVRDLQQAQSHVGYSIFETFAECYQYNENACIIAATRATADVFARDGDTPSDECRIDAVCFGDVMRDYGGSLGEYAMERDAFVRFQETAELNGVRFRVEPYDGDDGFLVVEIDDVVRADDE